MAKKGTAGKNISPVGPSTEQSVTVRKISNGYLVEKSGYVGNRYKTETVYHSENPLARRNIKK